MDGKTEKQKRDKQKSREAEQQKHINPKKLKLFF
jgi:hypothetical protein